MSRATSFFLDLLRLSAAGAVFASHCVLFWWPAQADGKVGAVGHRAVIVFFVLSGYVIAYTTLKNSMNVRDYFAARLARLYSVVFPAVLLTAALQVMGSQLNPLYYEKFERGHDVVRYLLTTFFLQSVWTTNTAPPTNGPFWSLGYEFWYYVIFGAAVFIKPLRRKVIWVVVLLATSGIDSLLLMPAWAAGVLLYLYGRKNSLPRPWALAGAIIALTASVGAILALPNRPGHYGNPPFFYSTAFLTDGLIALLLAAWIGLVDQAFRSANLPERLQAIVRWMADHTFSLYLYQFPIMLFVTAVLPFDRKSPLQIAGVMAMILLVMLLLSLVTEAQRGLWRQFFAWCWDRAGLLGRSRSASAVS